MKTIGIDAGAENCKAVALEGSRVLSSSIVAGDGESPETVALRALNALEIPGTEDGLVPVVCTGTGSQYLLFCSRRATESSCLARGAMWSRPSVRTIIDFGSNKCLVVKVKEGSVWKTVRNDKCASGTGQFLTTVGRILGTDVKGLGEFALRSQQDVTIEMTCSVFAESEVVSLLHANVPPEDIARAVLKGVAARINTMLLAIKAEDEIIMTGGYASNSSLPVILSDLSGFAIKIPAEPMFVSAIGAALVAQQCS